MGNNSILKRALIMGSLHSVLQVRHCHFKFHGVCMIQVCKDY
jgi:hypothetical protein